MSHHFRSFVPGALLVTLLMFAIGTALAQIPDEFENLQVLPKDISKRELVSVMRGFAGALGQRCNYCHVGESTTSLEGYDFASDEPEHKKTARIMMKMVQDINEGHLSKIGKESPVEVRCITCHRGVNEPETIDNVVLESFEEGGVEAATGKYRELREEYYGSGSYDFTAGPLNHVAEELARQKQDVESAIAVMQMNVELNPETAYAHLMLGQLLSMKGDKEAAIQSIEKAIELEPDNDWAKDLLEKVRSGN